MIAKNPQKQGRILEGGWKHFSGWPEYIPLAGLPEIDVLLTSIVGMHIFRWRTSWNSPENQETEAKPAKKVFMQPLQAKVKIVDFFSNGVFFSIFDGKCKRSFLMLWVGNKNDWIT